MQQPVQAQPYLPMEGHAAFRAAALRVLLGNEHPVLQQNRAVAVQTLGGSGALKLAADFLKRWYPQSRAFVSDPTWDNHRGSLEGAGIEVGTYPYYDPDTIGVRFAELTQFLHTLDSGDIVLLHPCCHNPTGVDLSPEQWDEVLHIIQSRRLIALLDIAYQGESLDVGFNITFLLDLLRNVHSDEVQLAFGSADRATLFTVPNRPEFKYVVMPMRI